MIRWCIAICFPFCLITADLSNAWADEALAKEKYKSGLKKLKDDDYKGAAADFEVSTAAYPNPNCLFNLALCYFELGRFFDSLTTFEKLNATFPDKLSDEDNVTIREKISEIKKILPRLEIAVQPDGAEVTLDNEIKGLSPITEPMFLAEGVHRIRVGKDGYEGVTREITLKKGEQLKETVTLTVFPPTPEVPPEPEAPAARTASPLESPSVQKQDRSGLKYNRVLMITGITGTGVLAGVSVGLWAAAAKKHGDYTELNNALKTEWNEADLSQRDEDLRRSEAYNTAAVVTTALTGAFIILTVTELVLKAKGKKRPLETVNVVPGGLAVRF